MTWSRNAQLAGGYGALRVAVGAGLLARPARISRDLGVDAVTADRTSWAVRMAGVRDVALGAGCVAAVVRGQDARPWLAAQVLADAGDAAVFATALRHGHVRRFFGAVSFVAAIGGVVTGVAALRETRRATSLTA